ncbi:MAG TPA: MOSC N-terminal beta barrel domain-containing protein [Micromonosporaceae bacterium]|nr:MOSC N-terminal beta barrel domain-containing protein [Micromonosporaceae bacterium]
MHVTGLHTYAIKGCYRTDVAEASVEPWGFAGDRRFMIVDDGYRMLTQREEPGLVRIRPELSWRQLKLRAAGHDDLVVDVVAGELVDTNVHSSLLQGALVDEIADKWISTVLGRTAHLLWLDDPTRRRINPDYSLDTDRVSFADGYPVLLANAASLDVLNDWLFEAQSLEGPLPMTRFRPNIVIGGAVPWAEDVWTGRRIRVGDVVFRVPKPCDRCVVTTTDQETGERGHEPLRTLARYRNVDQGLMFATNLIPDAVGAIRLGDEVTALD